MRSSQIPLNNKTWHVLGAKSACLAFQLVVIKSLNIILNILIFFLGNFEDFLASFIGFTIIGILLGKYASVVPMN